MSSENFIFSTSGIFEIMSVNTVESIAHIYVKSTQKHSICPNCNKSGSVVHSYYTRKINALPALGKQVTLYLYARKFYCRQAECDVKIFTERFKDRFCPHKRTTNRRERTLLSMVLVSGGRAAGRLSKKMGMPASDTTLLRLVDREPVPDKQVPESLGIDWRILTR